MGHLPRQSIKITTILYLFLLSRHFLKSTNIYYQGRSETSNGYKSPGFLFLETWNYR
jgi:hypothetical protein